MDLCAKVRLVEKKEILVSRLAFEFSFEQIARQSLNLDRGALVRLPWAPCTLKKSARVCPYSLLATACGALVLDATLWDQLSILFFVANTARAQGLCVLMTDDSPRLAVHREYISLLGMILHSSE